MQRDRRLIFNNRGFSLVETLISMAIVGFISLALAQLMRDSVNSANYVESKFDELELARLVQIQLMSKDGCEQNFKNKAINTLNPAQYSFLINPPLGVLGNVITNATSGANPATGGAGGALLGISNIDKMVDSLGSTLFSVNDVIGNRSLKITGIGFSISQTNWTNAQNAIASGAAPATGAQTPGLLVITGERMKTSYGGKTWSRGFAVTTTLDSSGNITGCYTAADDAASKALTIITQNFNTYSTVVNNTATTINNSTIAPKAGCTGKDMASAIICMVAGAMANFKF